MDTRAAAEVLPSDTGPPISGADKRQRWLEVFLVLVVACGGSVLNAVYLLETGPAGVSQFDHLRWTTGLFHEIISLLLLRYVLSRRRLGFRDIGLSWSWRQVGVGLILVPICATSYYMA